MNCLIINLFGFSNLILCPAHHKHAQAHHNIKGDRETGEKQDNRHELALIAHEIIQEPADTKTKKKADKKKAADKEEKK